MGTENRQKLSRGTINVWAWRVSPLLTEPVRGCISICGVCLSMSTMVPVDTAMCLGPLSRHWSHLVWLGDYSLLTCCWVYSYTSSQTHTRTVAWRWKRAKMAVKTILKDIKWRFRDAYSQWLSQYEDNFLDTAKILSKVLLKNAAHKEFDKYRMSALHWLCLHLLIFSLSWFLFLPVLHLIWTIKPSLFH